MRDNTSYFFTDTVALFGLIGSLAYSNESLAIQEASSGKCYDLKKSFKSTFSSEVDRVSQIPICLIIAHNSPLSASARAAAAAASAAAAAAAASASASAIAAASAAASASAAATTIS